MFAVFVILVVLMSEASAVDYCSENNFLASNGTTFMQFTKEMINREFAVEGLFKALHCCSKGYRSVEWWVNRACCQCESRRLGLILSTATQPPTLSSSTCFQEKQVCSMWTWMPTVKAIICAWSGLSQAQQDVAMLSFLETLIVSQPALDAFSYLGWS